MCLSLPLNEKHCLKLAFLYFWCLQEAVIPESMKFVKLNFFHKHTLISFTASLWKRIKVCLFSSTFQCKLGIMESSEVIMIATGSADTVSNPMPFLLNWWDQSNPQSWSKVLANAINPVLYNPLCTSHWTALIRRCWIRSAFQSLLRQ